jgi:hypothetical protein
LIQFQKELEEAMDAIVTAKKLTPLGKVELRVSAQSRGTQEHSNLMPNKQSLISRRRFDKSL